MVPYFHFLLAFFTCKMRLTLLCSTFLFVVESRFVLGGKLVPCKINLSCFIGTVQCKRVEAHFDGTFKNKHNSNLFIVAKFRMVIDILGKNDKVQMIIDQWNSSIDPNKNQLWLYQNNDYVYP
jgi:hypothetical protein